MSHQPKIAALIAYNADLLSEAGHARIERHLSECDVCHEALAQIKTYESARADLSEASLTELLELTAEPGTAPSIDWNRMDFALRQEAKKQAKAHGRSSNISSTQMILGGLIVAAAAALLFLAWPKAPNAPIADSTPTQTVNEDSVVTVAQLPAGILSAKNGIVWVDGKEAAIGTQITEESVVKTDSTSVAHVSINSTTGFVVANNSEVAVLRFRETSSSRDVSKEGILLGLNKGRVAQQVKSGSLYAVQSGPYTVHVRGTHFEVQHDDAEVGVTLDEGKVEITKDGISIATLDAPAQWHSAGTTKHASLRSLSKVPTPRRVTDSLDTLKQWNLSVKDNIQRLEVDGTVAQGRALSFLSPADSLVVSVWNKDGETSQSTVAWAEEGVVVERMFKRLPTVSSDDLQAIVRPHRASFSLCFDRTLRRNPDFRSSGLKVRITVGRDGAVRRAKVVGKAPAGLQSCLSQVSKRLSFDKKHAGLSLVLPLNLSTR